MRIFLVGRGRMGHALAELIAQKGYTLAGQVSRVQGLAWEEIPADLVIDFSHAEQVEAVVRGALGAGRALVTGTTGWQAQLETLRAWAEQLPAPRWLYSSNFSLGIRLLEKLLPTLAEGASLLPDWQAVLIETHHQHKKDAPSGTALTLAQTAQAHGLTFRTIHSIRVGEVPGEHHLLLSGPYESIEVIHRAYDRRVFAEGAIRAAEWLIRQRRYVGSLPF